MRNETMLKLGGVPVSIQEKILAYAVADSETGCLVWTKSKHRGGYGQLRIGGKNWIAHRAAYHHFVGPIPAGLTLDHLCRNKACVNPAHLEPVTAEENLSRAGAAKTHCKRGHEFDLANTYRRNGKRHCRKCGALRSRAHEMRTRALWLKNNLDGAK